MSKIVRYTLKSFFTEQDNIMCRFGLAYRSICMRTISQSTLSCYAHSWRQQRPYAERPKVNVICRNFVVESICSVLQMFTNETRRNVLSTR